MQKSKEGGKPKSLSTLQPHCSASSLRSFYFYEGMLISLIRRFRFLLCISQCHKYSKSELRAGPSIDEHTYVATPDSEGRSWQSKFGAHDSFGAQEVIPMFKPVSDSIKVPGNESRVNLSWCFTGVYITIGVVIHSILREWSSFHQ